MSNNFDVTGFLPASGVSLPSEAFPDTAVIGSDLSISDVSIDLAVDSSAFKLALLDDAPVGTEPANDIVRFLRSGGKTPFDWGSVVSNLFKTSLMLVTPFLGSGAELKILQLNNVLPDSVTVRDLQLGGIAANDAGVSVEQMSEWSPEQRGTFLTKGAEILEQKQVGTLDAESYYTQLNHLVTHVEAINDPSGSSPEEVGEAGALPEGQDNVYIGPPTPRVRELMAQGYSRQEAEAIVSGETLYAGGTGENAARVETSITDNSNDPPQLWSDRSLRGTFVQPKGPAIGETLYIDNVDLIFSALRGVHTSISDGYIRSLSQEYDARGFSASEAVQDDRAFELLAASHLPSNNGSITEFFASISQFMEHALFNRVSEERLSNIMENDNISENQIDIVNSVIDSHLENFDNTSIKENEIIENPELSDQLKRQAIWYLEKFLSNEENTFEQGIDNYILALEMLPEFLPMAIQNSFGLDPERAASSAFGIASYVSTAAQVIEDLSEEGAADISVIREIITVNFDITDFLAALSWILASTDIKITLSNFFDVADYFEESNASFPSKVNTMEEFLRGDISFSEALEKDP